MRTAAQKLVKDKKNKSTENHLSEFEFQITILECCVNHYKNLLKNGSRTPDIECARSARIAHWQGEIERLRFLL